MRFAVRATPSLMLVTPPPPPSNALNPVNPTPPRIYQLSILTHISILNPHPFVVLNPQPSTLYPHKHNSDNPNSDNITFLIDDAAVAAAADAAAFVVAGLCHVFRKQR